MTLSKLVSYFEGLIKKSENHSIKKHEEENHQIRKPLNQKTEN